MIKAISLTEKGIIIATSEKRVAEWIGGYVTPFIDGRFDLRYAETVSQFMDLVRLPRMSMAFIEVEFFGEEIIGTLDHLRKVYPGLQVILFAASDVQPEEAGRYFWWGGDSSVSLRSTPALIREQINAILKGQNCVYDEVLVGIRHYNNLPVYRPHFTSREIEIICCIAREKTIKETAKILAMSEHTVTNCLQTMYQKSGVNNMVGLVKAAFSVGILMINDLSIRFQPAKREAMWNNY